MQRLNDDWSSSKYYRSPAVTLKSKLETQNVYQFQIINKPVSHPKKLKNQNIIEPADKTMDSESENG